MHITLDSWEKHPHYNNVWGILNPTQDRYLVTFSEHPGERPYWVSACGEIYRSKVRYDALLYCYRTLEQLGHTLQAKPTIMANYPFGEGEPQELVPSRFEREDLI